MGSPISYDRRVKIVKRKKAGESTQSIAISLDVSVSGVRKIWKRYQSEGESAFYPNYQNCGRKSPFHQKIVESIPDIRDNDQGASYVHSKLLIKHPEERVPAIRTLQRWWQSSNESRPKGRPPANEKKKWSKTAHETWQIDGKEQVKLADGTKSSWMNIGDEGTSAHLKAVVDAAPYVVSIHQQAAIGYVNQAFERWGLPENIKIDNGRPFVHPQHMDMPTFAKLWWIGLGINVIQNTPRCPQQNGVVECLQGTMCSWSNPSACQDIQALQKRIDEESDFQRNHYKIPAKGYKTRIELHPDLETNHRKYNPDKFDMNLVDEFLSNQVWTRPIRKDGAIKFFGVEIYVSKRKDYIKREMDITFDPQIRKWVIRKPDGTLLKQSSKGVPSENQIKEFATMSKNKNTT